MEVTVQNTATEGNLTPVGDNSSTRRRMRENDLTVFNIKVETFLRKQRKDWEKFNEEWGETKFTKEQIEQEVKDNTYYYERQRIKEDCKVLRVA